VHQTNVKSQFVGKHRGLFSEISQTEIKPEKLSKGWIDIWHKFGKGWG